MNTKTRSGKRSRKRKDSEEEDKIDDAFEKTWGYWEDKPKGKAKKKGQVAAPKFVNLFK